MPSEKRRKCSKCSTNRAERFYVGARGRVCLTCQKATRRKAARKQRVRAYGLTPEEYQLLSDYQDTRCAICRQTRTYHLNIDHDHKVEKELGTRASVRGLLCRRCNKLLAVAGDNIEVLEGAVDYLRYPPWDSSMAPKVTQ